MTSVETTTNAYWEAVRDHIQIDRVFGASTPVVDTYGSISRDYGVRIDRNDLCSRYSWTVTDPATVEFVRDWAGGAVVDPLAGSGWWACLLSQAGVWVTATDQNPPDGTGANHWHRGTTHVHVGRMDAVDAAHMASPDRTLLLSWPPYDSTIGGDILAAYPGSRVIYIGEGWGGCCGDDSMFEAFERDWTRVAEHCPIQYYGIRDWVTVYERKVIA